MKKESEPRKRFIADAIANSGVQAVVYTADRSNDELAAGVAGLNALVEDAAHLGAHRLVLERDDSLIRWDNQRLIELTRRHGCRDSLSYELMRANEELLLGLPDAIAWCWTKRWPLAHPHHHRCLRPPRGLTCPRTDSAKPSSPTVRMAAGPTS